MTPDRGGIGKLSELNLNSSELERVIDDAVQPRYSRQSSRSIRASNIELGDIDWSYEMSNLFSE